MLEATVSTKRKAMVVLMAVTVDSSSGVGGDGNASSVLMVKISVYRMGRANVRGMMYIYFS